MEHEVQNAMTPDALSVFTRRVSSCALEGDDMTARHSLHRIRTPVVVCLLLVLPVSCDVGASPHDPAGPRRDAVTPTASAAPSTSDVPDGVTPRMLRKEPDSCPGRQRRFTMQDVVTVSPGREVADSTPDVT